MPVETAKYLKLLYIDSDSREIVDFSEDAKKPFGQLSKILIRRKSILKKNSDNDETKEIKDSKDESESNTK